MTHQKTKKKLRIMLEYRRKSAAVTPDWILQRSLKQVLDSYLQETKLKSMF